MGLSTSPTLDFPRKSFRLFTFPDPTIWLALALKLLNLVLTGTISGTSQPAVADPKNASTCFGYRLRARERSVSRSGP
jgi:hypothetical protein